jgi:hypothetical protein
MAFIETINDRAVRPEAGQALAGRLRARIANLEYILQRDSSRGASTHVLAPMVERLELLEKAVRRIGIQDCNGSMVGFFAREAEATCMTCARALDCRRWLDGAAGRDAYRRFCPNVALFDLLVHPALLSSPFLPDGAGSWMARLTRRAAAVLTAWRHRTLPTAGGRSDSTYYPSADDLRRMHVEASRREARALLGVGILL